MGRPAGARTTKEKWHCIYYDRENDTIHQGNFTSIRHINETFGLNIEPYIAHKIESNHRVDTKGRFKNAFIKQWNHIKLTKL